jgi:hypothetical protein
VLGHVWVGIEQVGVPRRPAGERGTTLAARVFDVQMHFLDMPDNALPLHGISFTATPFTSHNTVRRPLHSMGAQVS